MRIVARALLLASTVFAIAGCDKGPRPLAVGQDACDFCRMAISDDRFGGEIMLTTGRPRTFDAVECLVSYLDAGSDSALVRDVYVSDYENRTLIPAGSAIFLESDKLPSPMGNLTAFSPSADTTALLTQHGGRILTWPEVRDREKADTSGHRHPGQPAPDSVQESGSLSSWIAAARAHDTVRVRAGVYTGPTIVIDKPLTLLADSGAVLDGGGAHTVVHVRADDVTVRGFTVRNTGSGQLEERAGIKVSDASRCEIADNRIENTSFGIYLEKTADCAVHRNVLRGPRGSQSQSGNGIHAWSSERVNITGNDVEGHRDGIYFEFVQNGSIHDNKASHSSRYGMHFMFSNDCRYERNNFSDNGNGIAVMYSSRVTMRHNTFARSHGAAAYGLLLKDINDSDVDHNHFLSNSTALHLEGSNRNRVNGNTFEGNGLALRLLANAENNSVTGNTFTGNAFDVGTNSRQSTSTLRGNYWDRYRGYDLDRDGVGDVPFLPVRLFALIVEQSPPALILLRSIFVDMLDLAERVIPALTPQALRDEAPRMQPPVVS
jgi:nitrous oxidase accessory protein